MNKITSGAKVSLILHKQTENIYRSSTSMAIFVLAQALLISVLKFNFNILYVIFSCTIYIYHLCIRQLQIL